MAYPLQWEMSIEVDGEQVGQAQIHLDIEFDALQLWRSLGTAPRAGGTEDVLAHVSLSVSVGESALAGATASLQSGPWSYPELIETYATKYFASGWWQMMASVVCSGCSWNPSLTVTPMRSPPSSSTTLALSVRSGQAG